MNEPATVRVQGQPATLEASGVFAGGVPVAPGTTRFTITATDASGNTTMQSYDVDQAGPSKTFTFDANGNLTADGSRTFEWDARNQLVAVNLGTHRSQFTYDAQQRRVQVVEKENSVVQFDTKVIWCQTGICEERAADGTAVTRRVFTEGEQVGGVARFFTSDHLASVTDVTDASGGLTTRYTFDPWGRRTLASGVATTNVGFTGHEVLAAMGLLLSPYRAYDAELGGWISEDPIGLEGGLNLYRYVEGNPVRLTDEFGLRISCRFSQRTQFVLVTRCGARADGCTTPTVTVNHVSGGTTSPCERDPKCNLWKFDAIVNVRFLIEYSTLDIHAPTRGGMTLEQHEQGHVSDFKSWCRSLNGRFKSEGFKTGPECEAAKNAFDNQWRRTYQDADARTRARLDR